VRSGSRALDQSFPIARHTAAVSATIQPSSMRRRTLLSGPSPAGVVVDRPPARQSSDPHRAQQLSESLL